MAANFWLDLAVRQLIQISLSYIIFGFLSSLPSFTVNVVLSILNLVGVESRMLVKMTGFLYCHVHVVKTVSAIIRSLNRMVTLSPLEFEIFIC